MTGANTGVGKELAQILYSKNARIYVAARNEEKGQDAIKAIQEAHPSSTGSLVFMKLDLADLTTIKASAQQFLDNETKLHVLFNNAGVMNPPVGSTTKQGYELQLGVNNVGTFMFTQLLTPTLVATAKEEGPGSVRVVWVGSSATEAPLVPMGGVDVASIDNRVGKNSFNNYFLSKGGNFVHGIEYAERHRGDGIVSVTLNPGNLDSDLWRFYGPVMRWGLRTFVLHPSIYGAYTELFAGLSPEVTMEKTGAWSEYLIWRSWIAAVFADEFPVGPWGRFLTVRKDLPLAAKSKEEGGYGTGKAFWEWSEKQIEQYM